MAKPASFRWALIRLVAPAVLAVLLSMGAVWVVLIPATENALMERKRELLRAIVASAHSQLERYAQLERSGGLTRNEAQARAVADLRATRYGQEGKDYLWVIDRTPRMVMHPYRPELEGQQLADYRDADGKALFSAAVREVANKGDGYVGYRWQWQDDQARVVPKLSYVRLFESWSWIVGSGLYLEDVHAEIRATTSRLAWVGSTVAGLVGLLVAVALRQGWISECRRRETLADLARSHARFEALAQAGSEAVWLVIDGRVAAANRGTEELLGAGLQLRLGADAASLFSDPSDFTRLAGGSAGPRSALLTGSDGPVPALVTATPVSVQGQEALVLTARPLSGRPGLDEPGRELLAALQAQQEAQAIEAATLLSSAAPLAVTAPCLPLTATPDEVAATLRSSGSSTALLTAPDGGIAGLITASDLVRRGGGTAYAAMSAPVHRLDQGASLCAALDAMAQAQVGHLLVPDADGGPRLLSASQLLSALRTGPTQFIAAAARADQAGLGLLNRRLNAWMGSLARVRLDPELAAAEGTRIADAVLRRCVDLALADLGPAPAACALLVVGSQGRQELLPGGDQDNALVYADGAEPRWFIDFGRAVTARYHAAGWPRCPGGRMAGQERWCQPLSQWRERFAGWIRQGEPDDLLDASIFFDLRTVWGDPSFAAELQATIRASVSGHPHFALQLAQATLKPRAPLSLLGGIRIDDPAHHTTDLKLAMRQAVAAARAMTLRQGGSDLGTAARLRALAAGGHLGPGLATETLSAWNFLLGLHLALRCRPGGGDELDPESLSAWDRVLFKRALGGIGTLREHLRAELVRAGLES